MQKGLWYGGIVLIATAAVLVRLELMHPVRTSTMDALVSKKVIFEGIIDDEPDVRDTTQHLTLHITRPSDAKVLVTISRYQTYEYGEKIRVAGKLELPQTFDGLAGRQFDYPHFLAKDGIGYQMSFATIDVVGRGFGNPLYAALFALKEKYLQGLGMALPEPAAGLAAGINAGAKRSLGKDVLQEFTNTGTVAIVVLSGYNITIVSNSMLFLFKNAPRMLGSGLGMIAILLFVIATGSGASAVRAGIMAALTLVSRITLRTYDASRALLFAVVVMVVWNPLILLYDPGFQLSVLATIGIMYVSPLFESRMRWLPEAFGLRGIVSSTIGTQVTVLPFLLYQTGVLSVVALPANVLVLPVVPVAMFLSLIAGVVGAFAPSVAVFVGAPAYIALSYMLVVIEWLARLPFASLTVPAFPLWVVVVVYTVGVGLYFKRSLVRIAFRSHSN